MDGQVNFISKKKRIISQGYSLGQHLGKFSEDYARGTNGSHATRGLKTPGVVLT